MYLLVDLYLSVYPPIYPSTHLSIYLDELTYSKYAFQPAFKIKGKNLELYIKNNIHPMYRTFRLNKG